MEAAHNSISMTGEKSITDSVGERVVDAYRDNGTGRSLAAIDEASASLHFYPAQEEQADRRGKQRAVDEASDTTLLVPYEPTKKAASTSLLKQLWRKYVGENARKQQRKKASSADLYS
jgi:hypothetical protein